MKSAIKMNVLSKREFLEGTPRTISKVERRLEIGDGAF